MKNQSDRAESVATRDQAAVPIRIQTPSSSAIETELALRMESVITSIESLEQAQQITQDSLQLEVCV